LARKAPRKLVPALGTVTFVPVLLAVAAGATAIRVQAPAPSPVGAVTPQAAHEAGQTGNQAGQTGNEQPGEAPGEPGPPREPGSTYAKPGPVTMAFTGDILIHERLWESAATHAEGSARFDFRPMFAPVKPLIAGVDLAICHLETPLSPDDHELSSYPVFETPYELADAIAWAGYDGCSTASNHSLDGGTTGVRATLRALDEAGVGHVGTARSKREARRVALYDTGGARVAHRSYSWGFNGFSPQQPWMANRIWVPRVIEDAERARAQGADLVVVSLHWGEEYGRTPTAWQVETAERLTASHQIDLIVGHHAHVVQPVDRVNGVWVAYGVGNHLSGMTSSLGTSAVEDGVALLATASRRDGQWGITSLSFQPTWVEYGRWRVLPISRILQLKWPSDALRAELRASWARTVRAVGAMGARGLGVRPGYPR
jgi:poly-gamma-glutamate synthesis protein (capsule biosynthesis protein)